MGWPYYDIKEHVHHPDGLAQEFERPYWQVNLMCHLLRAFPYKQMYESPVWQAMKRFQGQVLQIDDDKQHCRQMELKKGTKKKIAKEFEWLAEYFKTNHEHMRMRELYTAVQPVEDSIAHFEKIQELIGDDTKSQRDPAGENPKGRFSGEPCQMCIPFLPIQNGEVPPVAKEVIDAFIAAWGKCDLADIFKTPMSKATRQQVAALQAARKSGALAPRRSEPMGRIIGFKNNLICQGGSCQSRPDYLCISAPDGSCSAVSDPKRRQPETVAQQKKRPERVG